MQARDEILAVEHSPAGLWPGKMAFYILKSE
jgi:hypothetical protein